MNFIFYVLITIATATVTIIWVWKYVSEKEIEWVNSYQWIKNLWEADTQSELAALNNKRYYWDSWIDSILEWDEHLVLQDASFMSKEKYEEFINQNVESDYKWYWSNSDRDWDGKWTYGWWQKWIDLNVDLSTKRLNLDSENNVLNSFSNNSYELPINSNIKYLSDNTDQLFTHLQIRWWDWFEWWKSDYQWDIQVTLYRFDTTKEVKFDNIEMLSNHAKNEKSMWDVVAKKILRVDESQDSSSSNKEASQVNPQADFFHKVADINDIVEDKDMEPKKYIYYLVVESLSNNPIPILIEAYNANWQPVWFVGDYKTTYDSTGIGLWNNRKRVQLYQTLKSQRMKYFNKTIFTEWELKKEVAR